MARVYFVRGPGNLPDVAAVTAEDGAFALSAPTPGSYEIASTADGFGTAKNAIEVRAGRPAHLDIRLQRTQGSAR